MVALNGPNLFKITWDAFGTVLLLPALMGDKYLVLAVWSEVDFECFWCGQFVFCWVDSCGSLLSLDTSLLISFNQPIMYCQPQSGILIGALSQASLLPPPMSPHVENHHSITCRNRECQVNICQLTGPWLLSFFFLFQSMNC